MARDLPQLREKIDQIDAAIVALLAQRMEVCREVAEVKAGSSTAVIQPQRVREVLTTRRQWAINSGVDADFAEQIFRTLLAETHRIEVAHERGGVAPTKVADTLLSALDTVAVRIDHVVVAVVDLASASSFLKTLGFTLEPTEDADIVTATAGGVTVVLVGPGDDPAVRAHLEANGSGVQHIAIEVLNAGFVQQALAEAGVQHFDGNVLHARTVCFQVRADSRVVSWANQHHRYATSSCGDDVGIFCWLQREAECFQKG